MPIFVSLGAQMLFSGPYQCQKLTFTQRAAQHVALSGLVVAASRRLSTGTHTLKSDVSSALVAQCFPHQRFYAPTSRPPSAAASAYLAGAPAAPRTQPVAFSFLARTESSVAFTLLRLELFGFRASYSEGKEHRLDKAISIRLKRGGCVAYQCKRYLLFAFLKLELLGFFLLQGNVKGRLCI